MSNDLLLVIGIVLAGFAIPSLISAFSDGRPPRVGAIMMVVGLGLVAAAVGRQPGGYTLNEVPDAFYRVYAQMMR